MEANGVLMIGGVLMGGYFALTALDGGSLTLDALPLGGGMVTLGSRDFAHASATRGDGVASDYLVARSYGANAEGPVAAHDASPAVFIGDALRDWRPADDGEVVGKVQLMLARTDCRMRPPEQGARLVHFYVEHPETKAGLWSYNSADLAKGVDKWFSNIRRRADGPLPGPMASHEFRVHDIAVSETAQPVHLVLQNKARGNMLYNIHLGPGARVSGVSMLGGDANAVANIAADVPVDVIDSATLADCGVPAADRVRGEAGIAKRIRDRKLRDDEDIDAARAELTRRVETYNSWFAAQFGVRADAALFGLSFAEVTLVGPAAALPGEPNVRYRPVAGAYVVAQTEQYFKVAGLHDWPEAFKDDVVDTGTALVGGDPRAMLLPEFFVREW